MVLLGLAEVQSSAEEVTRILAFMYTQWNPKIV